MCACVCAYACSTGTERLSCPVGLAPQLTSTVRVASVGLLPVCQWQPPRAPPSGSAQDLFLYISFTTRVPPSDFPECSSFRACSHLEMASQILKQQKRGVGKVPDAGKEVQAGRGSGRAAGSWLTPLHEEGDLRSRAQDPRCLQLPHRQTGVARHGVSSKARQSCPIGLNI